MQSKTYRMILSALSRLTLLLVASCTNADNISVNPNVKHQTMTGWETNGWAMQENPEFDNFKSQLFDLVVNDAGFNRTRLEIRSGAENSKDYWTLYNTGQISNQEWRSNRYATVNDNTNPLAINTTGFHFSEVDDLVNRIVFPLKQLVEKNNEHLYINLVYVAFTGQISGGNYHHDNPAEYAEFILAAFLHLKQKYGWVPDAVELILEPDNNISQWNGTLIGQALVEVARRLKTAGFTPDFIAPSTMSMSTASSYFDDLIAVPGAVSLLSELSYHRYADVSAQALQNIVNRANSNNIKTSMLEWWFNSGGQVHTGHHVLHEDIKVGMNSAWEQGAMAGNRANPIITDAYQIDTSTPGNPVVTINEMTKFSRQYYKFIRTGAIRIGATSDNSDSDPLAFINTNGKYVVVTKTASGRNLTIDGLPAGVYGIKYATSGQYDVDLPDQSISNGESLVTNIPASGVITVYAKTIANTDVDLEGTIKTSDGTDICAMVLASGKFMFSCNPSGVFSLTGLPLENNGTVKRQIYADGFFPKVDILTGSSDDAVVMTRSGTCPSYNTPYDPDVVPGSAGKRINIAGKVLIQNSQTPICAMVLANGQYMFSCDGSGSYALNIPLDSNGQFKSQVYADGFAPTIQTFDEFSADNDVRMARSGECQAP